MKMKLLLCFMLLTVCGWAGDPRVAGVAVTPRADFDAATNSLTGSVHSSQAGSANLTNWSLYSTNVWNPRQGGSSVLTNLSITSAITNLQAATGIQLGTNSGVIYITNMSSGLISAVNPDWFEVAAGILNLTNQNLTNWSKYTTNIFASQTQLNSASNTLRTDIGNLQTATNGLDSRVTTIEGTTNSFLNTNKVGSAAFNLTTDFQPANGNLTNWAGLTTNAFPSFSNLNTASNALRSDITDLQSATNGLNASVGNLRTATNGLDTRVTTLEGTTNLFVTTNLLSGFTTNRNAAIGQLAMTSIISSGTGNVAVGYSALRFATDAYKDTAVGYATLTNDTSGGSENTAVGFEALRDIAGGYWNVGVGVQALRANQSGYAQTAVGWGALDVATTGHENTAIGYSAMDKITGIGNVAVGVSALANATGSGYGNVAIGRIALAGSSGLGRVIAIGPDITASVDSTTNSIGIGANVSITRNNQTVIGKQMKETLFHDGGIIFTNTGGIGADILVNGTNSVVVTNLSASKLILTDASKRFVSSSFADADISNLQTSTNGLNTRVGNLETVTNTFQIGSPVLTNLVTTVDQNVTNAESTYFKVAAGALTLTNINLTNWAKIDTNTWNSREGGSAVLTNLVATGALTNVANVVFVTTDGNDSTGVRGNPQHPFLTVINAMSNSLPGDVVYVGPGTYLMTNRMVLSNNISIIGSGRKSTIFKNYQDGLHALLVPNTNTYIAHLQITNMLQTTTNQIAIGSVDFANVADESLLGPTNVVIRDVELWGDNNPFTLYQGNIWNIRFEDSWIGGASAVLLTGSTMKVDFFNCIIRGDHSSTVLAGTGGTGMDISNTSTVNCYNTYVYGRTNSVIINDTSTVNMYGSVLTGGDVSFLDSPSKVNYKTVNAITAGTSINSSTNSNTGAITLWVTNFTGSGNLAASNAPSLFAPKINSATASRVALLDANSQITNSAAPVADSTYRSVTTTSGIVTAGSNPTTFSGYGISDSSANFFSALTDKNGSSWTNLDGTKVTGVLTNNTSGNATTATSATSATSATTATTATFVTTSPLTNYVTKADGLNHTNAIYYSGVITPNILTNNQNDWNPTGFSTATVLNLQATNGGVNLTGLQTVTGDAAGRMIYLFNTTNSTITLKNRSASSQTTNRFEMGADYALQPSTFCVLYYNSLSNRWFLGGNGGSGITAGTYRSVTVNANGLVTAGTTPTTFSAYGISDSSANLASAITDETGSGGAVFSNAPSLFQPVINSATVSRNAVIDANGIVTNDVPYTGTGAPVLSNAPSFYAPKVNSATVSRMAFYSSGGLLTNGTLAAADFPALTGDVTTSAGSLATTLAVPHTVLTGNTGNASVLTSITWFQGVSTCFSNAVTSDVSGGTRSLMPRGGTLTNLYFIASGTLGNNQTNTITIMTNGVATGITCLIQGTSLTSASDTTHSATIPAGVEVGIKMVTTSSATLRKFAWAIEY